jgi:hypothetical protein
MSLWRLANWAGLVRIIQVLNARLGVSVPMWVYGLRIAVPALRFRSEECGLDVQISTSGL